MHRGMQRVMAGADCLSCKVAVIIIIRIVNVEYHSAATFYTYLLFWIWFGHHVLCPWAPWVCIRATMATLYTWMGAERHSCGGVDQRESCGTDGHYLH